MPALSFLSSTLERAKPAVARTSTGGKPTEMGVRYLSKNDAIELSHLHQPFMLTLSLLRRSDALKRQDGNFAAGFALVFGKTRHHLDHFGVKLAAFGLSGRGGTDLEAPGANLDGRDRVGQQVVVPVGIAGRAAFGGDDDKAVPIGDIGHRRGARLAAFRANCGQ